MRARSAMMTTARNWPARRGATASTRAEKLVSANSSTEPASLRIKATSSGGRRGFTVWQTACMPEMA